MCTFDEYSVVMLATVLLSLFVARVSRVTAVSSRCVIGAGCSVDSAETIPPDTMICGRENRQFTMKTVVCAVRLCTL